LINKNKMEKQEIKTSFEFIKENCKTIGDCLTLEKELFKDSQNKQKEVFLKDEKNKNYL